MLSPALKSELDRLSVQDKLEVFEVIRSSVIPASAQGFPELSASQLQELLLRAERAAANPGAGRSWEEIQQHLGA